MKYCKDCKHSVGDYCMSPRNVIGTDPVDGELVIRRWSFCTTQRKVSFGIDILLRICGKRARFFEQK